MGGGYDGFEDAKRPVLRWYELALEANAAVGDPARLQSVRDEASRLFADDCEYVTRRGTFRGPDKFISQWEAQLERYAISWEPHPPRLFDAGDAVVTVARLVRRVRGDPSRYLDEPMAAAIFRVRNGVLVYIDTFLDARDAFEAAGLDPALARSDRESPAA